MIGTAPIKGCYWMIEGSRCLKCGKPSHAILNIQDRFKGYCKKHYKQLQTEGLIIKGQA